MTLTVQIKVPSNAGNHEAEVKCSTDGYKHATVLAPGDELTVHVHAANEVHIAEVPAGTKAARTPANARPPHQQRVLDEVRELTDRLSKLDAFILENPVYLGLPVSERDRLSKQSKAMATYAGILNERIAQF